MLMREYPCLSSEANLGDQGRIPTNTMPTPIPLNHARSSMSNTPTGSSITTGFTAA